MQKVVAFFVNRILNVLFIYPNVFLGGGNCLIISNKIYFDSLDLINKTNLGFSGPTILEKRGEKLVYLLEVTAQSKDSFNLLFNMK